MDQTLFNLSEYETEGDRSPWEEGDRRVRRHQKNKPMSESKPARGKAFDSDIAPPNISAFVETYTPGGNARGFSEYFRLRYWDCFAPGGGRWKYRHIKGGNINSPMAQRRAEAIREAIAMGRSPQWVKSLCG
jgi:hypothetical protein